MLWRPKEKRLQSTIRREKDAILAKQRGEQMVRTCPGSVPCQARSVPPIQFPMPYFNRAGWDARLSGVKAYLLKLDDMLTSAGLGL